MRILGPALVLLAAFTLGVSILVPVEDAPETPYDESEVLPYQSTPLFASELPAQLSFDVDRRFRSKTTEVTGTHSVQPDVLPAVSLTIPGRPLRC